jgi:hypothetical protein
MTGLVGHSFSEAWRRFGREAETISMSYPVVFVFAGRNPGTASEPALAGNARRQFIFDIGNFNHPILRTSANSENGRFFVDKSLD